ncbi:hypothetical protein [Desulfatitalea tepidiphila]|uniref:hypothetical protein n=1 Tax=Desulfatitalea tepidiphila TaxID=1185843 RepID=UPI000975C47A|nr:hypothetical protein [Desulfatitalea tepidiphila]
MKTPNSTHRWDHLWQVWLGGYRWGKYLVRPKFSFISLAILMNADKYNSLTKQQLEWIQSAAIKSEKDAMAFFRVKHEEEVKELQSLGMEIVQMPEADAVRIDKLMSDTMWAVAEKKSGEP